MPSANDEQPARKLLDERASPPGDLVIVYIRSRRRLDGVLGRGAIILLLAGRTGST